MRLGAYRCAITPNTIMEHYYKTDIIEERHRHRYEFNNEFRDEFIEKGLTIAGTSPDGRLVEAIEIKDHPCFLAVQFHPEFKSRPNRPHPCFMAFVEAAINNK